MTGLAIGCAVCPNGFSRRARALVLATFAVLANAPDAPLPSWGHSRYDLSHSLLVTSVLTGGAAAALLAVRRWTSGLPLALIGGGAVAWYSHLLLDTFYNHGKGVALFWPVSDARVALPIPFFATMKPATLISAHNATVFAIEAAAYGALLLLVVVAKSAVLARRAGGRP